MSSYLKLITIGSAVVFTISACNSQKKSIDVGEPPAGVAITDSLPPVETQAPNRDYKPAFPGQTRINGVRTKASYNVAEIATGIGSPWAIIPLPDGRLLVNDKKGFMQIFSADGKLEKKITGLPPVDSDGQGGLLDVVLDPDFSTNRTLYWSFSHEEQVGNLMAVAKGKLSADELKIENPVIIFKAVPALKSSLHFGSRLVFDKDGHLFVSTGDRSILEGRAQAQLLTSDLGKIFKITKDGQPAPGNPFIGRSDARPEIYAYGIRNAQGLVLHPVTGDLWENEFGPRGGDELNIIKPGKNYGWPVITYGEEYSGSTIGEGIAVKEGMEQPVYYWDPVLSPSGMDFYRGDAIPEWKNNLFIGGLSSMHIARLVINNNKVVGEERLVADRKERFRDVTYHPNGSLYAVTDAGVMFKIGK